MAKGKENLIHIGVFGRTNSGKSSLINAISGQDIAIVSDIAGTTTDPVKKSIEILGLGNVILIDTAGINDHSILGNKRIHKTLQMLDSIDIAIILITEDNFGQYELDIIKKLKLTETPFLIVANKSDVTLTSKRIREKIKHDHNTEVISISTLTNDNIDILILQLIEIKEGLNLVRPSMLKGLVDYGDLVLLVTPIDSEAPEGRMILPQVNAIRDSIDKGCITVVVRETELELFLKTCNIKPKIVITDSQVFNKVAELVPDDIMLTGFSVLLARLKGDFKEYLKGTYQISQLRDGDRVLLLESCTHTTSCEDIGRIKIPNWLRNFTGKDIEFDVVAGLDMITRPIDDYSLVIQCGGCVITRKQLTNRLQGAKTSQIPISNYGLTIAYVQGIFNRAIQPFL